MHTFSHSNTTSDRLSLLHNFFFLHFVQLISFHFSYRSEAIKGLIQQTSGNYKKWLKMDKLVEYGLDKVRDRLNFHSTFETLQRNLKTLSDREFDVTNQVKNAELSGKKKRKREVENWLTNVKMIEDEFLELENQVQSQGYFSRVRTGDREAKLNQRVVELLDRSQNFGELLLDVVDGKRGQELLTKRLIGKAFEKNVEIIWERLANDEVKSIGVYGMGGVGKTTLTKHIHNKLVREMQDSVVWVTVSHVRNISKLQDEIARSLDILLSDEDSEDKRASSLYGALSQRRNFFMILDDVWGNIDLEKLGDPLGVEGGRLMITTRSLEVCRRIGCREVIEVKILSEDEAWELFRETLGQETALSHPIQHVAKSMAEVCDGLPLGIITVAGGMRGETDVRVWRDALVELKESVMGQHEMEDKVFKVLKYSFDRLDPGHIRQEKSTWYTELQLCFLYCSLYPEDYRIERKELIGRFILEELVGQRKRVKEQVDKGHSILNKLVNVCLLERTCDYEDEDCVKMHDLVRAMALRITEGKSMVKVGYKSLKRIPNERKWTNDLDKVSLMRNNIVEIPDGISPNCANMSTLRLDWNQNLQVIPESFFSRMDNLSTLDLSHTGINELPNSLSGLETMKALILEGCSNLVNVPYLGKMKALKQLDLSWTRIRELPPGVEKLVNLKWLLMGGAFEMEMLPKGILLNFPYLQRLHIPDKIEAPLDELERLDELEEFSGRVKSRCDFNRFIQSQQRKEVGVFYSIFVGKQAAYKTTNVKWVDYTKVVLYKIDLNKEEERSMTMLARDIQHLEFVCCECVSGCLVDDFPLLDNPKSIQTLEIKWCEGIECITRNHEHAIGDVVPSQAIFSYLKKLSVVGCNKMKKLGVSASQLSNLEQLSIENCVEIEEIVTRSSEKEEEEDEEEGHMNNIVPSILNGRSHIYHSFPKLKKIWLYKLPKLKSICKATIKCINIEEITLRGCPLLNEVPLYFPVVDDGQTYYSAPPSLREINILQREKEWWESMVWEHPSHTLLLQPLLRFR
ncbi:hypothetical protein ABFS82_04G148100 [Erythranthe guttata]